MIDRWHLFAPHREHKTPSKCVTTAKGGETIHTSLSVFCVASIFWNQFTSRGEYFITFVESPLLQKQNWVLMSYSNRRHKQKCGEVNAPDTVPNDPNTRCRAVNKTRAHLCLAAANSSRAAPHSRNFTNVNERGGTFRAVNYIFTAASSFHEGTIFWHQLQLLFSDW